MCFKNSFEGSRGMYSRASISQDYWGDIKEDWETNPQKLKLFVKLHVIFALKQTTVAVTRVDILNDITSKILGGALPWMSRLHKYWGDMFPRPIGIDAPVCISIRSRRLLPV